MSSITCTKQYRDFPFAHRQPNHGGHCQLIHGHNWGFDFVFGAYKVDSCGFVIDFGSLGWLKAMLNEMFDHTLVLNRDDPFLVYFQETLGGTPADGATGEKGCPVFAKIVTVPNCGSEGLAIFLYNEVDRILRARTKTPDFPLGRVYLKQIVVHEDERNSATFTINPV